MTAVPVEKMKQEHVNNSMSSLLSQCFGVRDLQTESTVTLFHSFPAKTSSWLPISAPFYIGVKNMS